MHADEEPVGVEFRSAPSHKLDQHFVGNLRATGKQLIKGWPSGVPDRSEAGTGGSPTVAQLTAVLSQ